MLESADVVAFVPTRDPAKSRAFYQKTLGLKFVSEDPFALVFEANGVTIRIANVSTVKSYKPAAFTILGFHVPNAEEAVKQLSKKGVVFERYEGMDQDALGIWNSPSGARIAWFKDPDGNILSIAQG
jgi:catechol 2,3-dioxygenase-like lactoylglutathione lyase family enzyme